MEGSTNSSTLSTLSAPSDDTNKLDSFSVHLGSEEITCIESRTSDRSLKTSWIHRIKSTDDVLSRSCCLQACGHVKGPEKLCKDIMHCVENRGTVFSRSDSLIDEQEVKSFWKVSTGASLHAGNMNHPEEQKEFDVSGALDVLDTDKEGLLNKENAGVLQASFGFGPKPNQLSHNLCQTFSNYNPDSTRVEMIAPIGLRKPPMPPVLNKLMFNLRHPSERSRGFSLCPTLASDLCIHSNKQISCKELLFQKPLAVIGKSTLGEHVHGLVMPECSQAPSSSISREDCGKAPSEFTSSILMGERNHAKNNSIIIPESQPSEDSLPDLSLNVSHGTIGIKSRESSKRRTTRFSGLHGNALTTLNLFVESSNSSKNAEAHYSMENHAIANQGKALVRDIDYGLMLGLNIDISACEIGKQTLPMKIHLQSENCEKVAKTNTEHISQILDMNMNAEPKEKDEDTSYVFDAFKGGMEVDLDTSERFDLNTEHISLLLDMNLKAMPSVDKQTIIVPHGMCKQTVGLLKDQELQHCKAGKFSSSNMIIRQPKLALDLNKENTDVINSDEVDILKTPHDNRQRTTNILGKRRQERAEEFALPRRKERHNVAKSQKNSSKHQVWIQRWYSARTRNAGISGQASALLNAMKEKDALRYLALGVKQFKGGDVCRIFAASTTDMIQTSTDLGQELESYEMSYMKSLPSAAAMAIVGTAARQFCNKQSQKKGSFSFWSGFGSNGRSKTQMGDHP